MSETFFHEVIFDCPPGSLIVVGPCGRLAIGYGPLGQCRAVADRLTIYEPGWDDPVIQRAVAQAWEERTEYGAPLRKVVFVPLSALPQAVRVAAPDPVLRPPRRSLLRRLFAWWRA